MTPVAPTSTPTPTPTAEIASTGVEPTMAVVGVFTIAVGAMVVVAWVR